MVRTSTYSRVLPVFLAFVLATLVLVVYNSLQYQRLVYHEPARPALTPSQPIQADRSKDKLFVIIVAGFRTGSTLLGEFFNQNRDALYIFEPLHQVLMWSNRDQIPGATPQSSLDELRILYLEGLIKNCSAYSSTNFRNMMEKIRCGASQKENLQRFGTRHCTLPTNMISKLCNTHNVVVVKTIRIRDINVISTISNIRDYNLKVIHLLRDPRGTINSRKSFSKFYLHDLEELPVNPLTTDKIVRVAHDYCDHEYDNLFLTDFMPDWLDGNYMRVTHDQLSKDPQFMLEQMYGFLGLQIPGNMREWAYNLTRRQHSQKGALTTKKNAAQVLDKWRRNLQPDLVKVIEQNCRGMMQKLGLEFVFY